MSNCSMVQSRLFSSIWPGFLLVQRISNLNNLSSFYSYFLDTDDAHLILVLLGIYLNMSCRTFSGYEYENLQYSTYAREDTPQVFGSA